jgi:preprotein translocase subunit SecA
MVQIFKKIFGTQQTRLLRRYQKIVTEINEWESKFSSLSKAELRDKTREFQERIAQGEDLDALLPEAYATVKNMCRRLCGTQIHVSGYEQKWDMVPYDVQLLGAIAMHYGAIAEMQTGEGKTLTASMPLYLNALTKKPVHLVTVNDYLAERDCQWIGTILRELGLVVESLTNSTPQQRRKEVYAADVVYGTASEFGFDYLRDNSTAQSKEEQCQRGFFFAIIDEVDSILIDEARTPLIISGPAPVARQMYDELKGHVAEVIRLQRDHCNRLATEARKALESSGWLVEGEKPKLPQKQEEHLQEVMTKLWLVEKGMPRNKILRRLKEDPEIRAGIEKRDTYFYHDNNKAERALALSELYVVLEGHGNDYELTDKGIAAWPNAHEDFTMLDLGERYAQIDANSDWDEAEKMRQKVALRQEDSHRKERAHNLRQLFRAHLLMERDVHYIVDKSIIIIDENTGRPQPGRRFSDGLHQAIEAKEDVEIQGETRTYATITLQNYFRMYTKLAGMTGTAMTEAHEFKQIYKLSVLAIPTYRPCRRISNDDQIYMTKREKYAAILNRVKEIHREGRPILIGTESVEESEVLSRIFTQNKLRHTLLNARRHADEAAIIAEAGKMGAITIATNMAGRGTDIKLEKEVEERGGVHMLGTTRNFSRRIDLQLAGRAGRLGDRGSSEFVLSFEDALLKKFAAPGITMLLMKLRPPEGEAVSAKMLNRAIETAQKRVEQSNFMMRKHTLEYDDVLNEQRKRTYEFRNLVLHADNPLIVAQGILEEWVGRSIDKLLAAPTRPPAEYPAVLTEWLRDNFPITIQEEMLSGLSTQEEYRKQGIHIISTAFQAKVAKDREALSQIELFPLSLEGGQDSGELLGRIVRSILVRTIDAEWQRHLLWIEDLRTEVSIRAVGQKDPLLEFKQEAFSHFSEFTEHLREKISHGLFQLQISPRRVRSSPLLVT